MATNPFAVPENTKKTTQKTAYKNPFGIKEQASTSDPQISDLASEDPWGNSEPIYSARNDNVQSFQQLEQKQPGQNAGYSNPFGGVSNSDVATLDIDFSMDGTSETASILQQQPQQQYKQQTRQTGYIGNRQVFQEGTQRQLAFDPNNVDPDNEPPLLVELGIDLKSIQGRMISVLKFTKCDEQLLEDPDMSGPLIIGFIFGFLLLLSGKLHFGYIYGFGISGTIGMYCIMNFLSMQKQIPLYSTMSILGYCLMPMLFLALLNVFLNLKGLSGVVGGALSILWATVAATNFFVVLLSQNHQKYLVAYPIFLFYCIFALITVF